MKKILALLLCLSLFGCATWEHNRKALFNLKIGQTKDEVLVIMKRPYKTESYQSKEGVHTIWFYETFASEDILGRGTQELTPLVFKGDNLIGWGQNFYDTSIKIKQDLNIKQQK